MSRLVIVRGGKGGDPPPPPPPPPGPIPISYQLGNNGPTQSPLYGVENVSAVAADAVTGPTALAFLGSGLLRPFVRDQKSDFANGSGIVLIQACVGQILGTMASQDSGVIRGELRWRPNFGARFYLLKHRKGPRLAQLASIYARECLARWEPRVTNVSVTAAFYPLETLLSIDLVYDVITRNVSQNQVVIQGVTQTVGVPIAT